MYFGISTKQFQCSYLYLSLPVALSGHLTWQCLTFSFSNWDSIYSWVFKNSQESKILFWSIKHACVIDHNINIHNAKIICHSAYTYCSHHACFLPFLLDSVFRVHDGSLTFGPVCLCAKGSCGYFGPMSVSRFWHVFLLYQNVSLLVQDSPEPTFQVLAVHWLQLWASLPTCVGHVSMQEI